MGSSASSSSPSLSSSDTIGGILSLIPLETNPSKTEILIEESLRRVREYLLELFIEERFSKTF